MKANPNRQSLIWIFSFLFISSIMVYSTGYNDPLIASQVCLINGNCTLTDVIVDDLLINGNLTFIGQVYNLTVINQNVSGTLDIEGNIFVDNATANWFFGNYNWSIAGVPSSNYLSFDGSILTFSETNLNATIEAHLASIIYYVDSFAVTEGTEEGGNNLGNLTDLDGDTFNVTEDVGVSPLYIEMNITMLDTPNQICMGHRYIGTHSINVDCWKEDISTWVNFDTITQTSSITSDCRPILNGDQYLIDGKLMCRFDHVGNGAVNHKLLIDYFYAVHGLPVTSNDEQDSLAIHKDGSTPWEGNDNHSSYNVTDVSYYCFDNGECFNEVSGSVNGTDINVKSINSTSVTATGTIQAEHLKTTDDLEVADDILLGSQSVINFNSGDVTITHGVNQLTIAGGTLYVDNLYSSGYGIFDNGFEATGNIYFYDDMDVDGKLNANGGIDPPYVLIDLQTKEQIVMRTRQEIPFSKAGGRAYVNIIGEPRIKWFIPLTCEFYGEKIDRDGWIVPTVIDTWNDGQVCYNTNSMQRYYYDRITDTIKISETTIYNNSFPEDKVLNRETGVIEDKPILIGERT